MMSPRQTDGLAKTRGFETGKKKTGRIRPQERRASDLPAWRRKGFFIPFATGNEQNSPAAEWVFGFVDDKWRSQMRPFRGRNIRSVPEERYHRKAPKARPSPKRCFSTRSGKATPPVTAFKAHSLSGVEQFAEAFRRGASYGIFGIPTCQRTKAKQVPWSHTNLVKRQKHDDLWGLSPRVHPSTSSGRTAKVNRIGPKPNTYALAHLAKKEGVLTAKTWMVLKWK
jgi:hypothetical protein